MKDDGIYSEINAIDEKLSKKQERFDLVMDMSRQVIRLAGQSITLLHNGENAESLKKIKDMEKMVKKLQGMDSDFRYNSVQAYQEYMEALCFYWIKTKRLIPKLADVDVPYEAYILGLMDVVGELKREILESLSKNDIKSAEAYLGFMKRIYDGSRSTRFAEPVLPGFRKKQDVARIQIEGAGSEILSARRMK